MINNTHGLDAREALALALLCRLGLPPTPTGTAALTVAALDSPSMPMIQALAAKVLEDRQDAVVGLYRSARCGRPDGFALIYRTMHGVRVMEAHPLSPDKMGPMVLFCEEDACVVAIDERGILREQRGRRVRFDQRSRDRGMRRLYKAAANIQTSDAISWETTRVAVAPGRAAAAPPAEMH